MTLTSISTAAAVTTRAPVSEAAATGSQVHRLFGFLGYFGVVAVLAGLLMTVGGDLVIAATNNRHTDRRATAAQVRAVGISCIVVGAIAALIGLTLR